MKNSDSLPSHAFGARWSLHRYRRRSRRRTARSWFERAQLSRHHESSRTARAFERLRSLADAWILIPPTRVLRVPEASRNHLSESRQQFRPLDV